MSKRLITLIVSGVLIPLATELLGISPEAIYPVVAVILGYLGVETVRPSGTVGVMGGKGTSPN